MNKLEESRKLKEWTRRTLSDESGMSEETIYKIEKKNYKAKPVVIKKLAEALDIDFEDLKDLIKGME